MQLRDARALVENRRAATLALRDVYLGGLDLGALRQLGVRFLSFPPHAVDAGSGPSAAWRDFAAEARALQRRFAIGGALWAGGLAIALLLRLLGLSLWRSRKDYEPDRAACVSCGRCFAACPVGRKRTPPDQVP